MNNMIRRLLPLAVCLALLVSACTPGDPQPSGAEPGASRGRYVESQMTLPDNLIAFMGIERLEDDTLMLFGFQRSESGGPDDPPGIYRAWSSGDSGASWQEELYPWMEDLYPMGMEVSSVSFTSADEMYILGRVHDRGNTGEDGDEPSEEEGQEDQEDPEEADGDEESPSSSYTFSYRLYKATRQGMELLADSLEDVFDSFVNNSARYQDGTLLLNEYHSSKVVDLETFSVRHSFELEADAVFGNYYVDGDTFAIMQPGAIQLYSLSSGELQHEIPCATVSDGEMGYSTLPLTAIAPQQNGEGIYYCNSNGIYRVLADGSGTERLLDGELCSLGMPSDTLLHFLPMSDGSFVTLSLEMPEYTYVLRRYTFDETAPSVPEIELSLYSLKENVTIRQAIGQFQNDYPQARVNYQVGLSGDDAVTVADALRSLSTELLAGKGPDLILMDGISIDSYVEKGVLLDLSTLIDERIQSGELMENIVNTFRDGDTLYAVPARFSVPMLHGEGVGEIESLSDLADLLEGQTLASGFPSNIAMERVYPVASYNWFERDGTLDSDALAKDLESLARLADPYRDFGDWIWTEEEGLTSGSLDMIANINAVNFGYLNALHGLAGPHSAIEEMGTGEFVLYPKGGGIFIPGTILGVNAATDHAELALGFIETVLSKDNMLYASDDGLPVNRLALEQTAVDKGELDRGSWGFTFEDPDTGEYTNYILDLIMPPTEEIQVFIRQLDTLDKPCVNNAVVQQLIIDETAPYFSGDKSLEDTLGAITSKLSLYLAETDAS